VEEIFAVVRKRIEDTGLLEQMSAGVVLTGGAVLLQGMSEFAEEILGMPVRIGMPTGIKGITQLVHGPEYATGVGLVKYGARAVSEASLVAPRGSFVSSAPPPRTRTQSQVDEIELRKSGFWEWIKAAF
jgi:cell division protein FtsA